MYDELIKMLRKHYDEHCPLDRASGICGGVLANEAADAIEELSIVVESYRNRMKTGNDWILIKSRPMDDEERREWSEKIGLDLTDDEAIIYTSQLPDDGQRVLVYSKYGGVSIDTFVDDDDGCYFEDNGDMDGIVAWMPRPEPPKEEK